MTAGLDRILASPPPLGVLVRVTIAGQVVDMALGAPCDRVIGDRCFHKVGGRLVDVAGTLTVEIDLDAGAGLKALSWIPLIAGIDVYDEAARPIASTSARLRLTEKPKGDEI